MPSVPFTIPQPIRLSSTYFPLNTTPHQTPSTQHCMRVDQVPSSPTQSPVQVNGGCKRKRASGTKSTSKRTKSQVPPQQTNNHVDLLSAQAVPGIGPSTDVSHHPPTTHPQSTLNYSPVSKHHNPQFSKQLATDVWYFLRPLETRERPNEPLSDVLEPSCAKLKTPFVGCRLCPP